MRTLFTVILFFISGLTFAQKAKLTAINCKYRHMRLPDRPELSAKYWALTITEQTACRGAIPYSKKHSPLAGVDPRAAFYMRLIPNQPKFFSQTSDLINNLLAKQTPFTHFELETGDIQLRDQVTKNAKPGANVPQYYMLFSVRVPIHLTATRKGDVNEMVLDTNASQMEARFLRFPMDVQLGTAPDIKPNGYPTEAELLAAWRKYGEKTEMQWRDKIISDFLTPVFGSYKQTYIRFEEWQVCKVYSDKNKKGGYDHLVEAAEQFSATIKAVDEDYKNGDLRKFYKHVYQQRFIKCLEIWRGVLEEFDFNVTSKDDLIDADDRQKILLNYIQALMYTKQFDEVERQISHYLKQDIRNVTIADLKRLRRLNHQFSSEYTSNAESLGWE